MIHNNSGARSILWQVGNNFNWFLLIIACYQACRPTFFKKSMRKFNVAWWAYSFPLTLLALASTEYAQEVKMHIPSGLMLILSAISVLVFVGVMFSAALNVDQGLLEDDPILNFGNNLGSRAWYMQIKATKIIRCRI